ncbi:uncharacterized protein LOC124133625 [Haliotis rufescens]|uniref:uncharacterized protein LOC124133625 n=1 Tax=Haliotis rufescens TaxID=6454 RepID=UPI00201F3098|nr:uncharacterized protein LOC124133625 [Haliotis rufescens]XP_046354037.2 uncharacterized protein LOC124133625 [Haliotis rufescens]
MDLDKVKKKTQLGDGTLRIDHSDVYFENDRLSEEQGIFNDILLKYKHRQYINRDVEIKELRRTLGGFEAMKKSAHHANSEARPKTTPVYMKRPQRPVSTASQARVVKLNVRIPDDSDSDSSSYSSSDDSSVSREVVTKAKAHIQPKVISKAGLITAQLENRKFPSSWYTDVLLPSDAVVKKRTPTPASGLGRSRSACHRPRTRQKPTFSNADGKESNEPADDKPSLVCSRSKSAVLSRRKLIQMTNLDHMPDSEEKTEPVVALREMNRIQNERLQVRVRMFLDSLDELKKRQAAARHSRRISNIYGSGGFYDDQEPMWR